MEYQVTAARRRPQRFEDLLGQDFVAATLQKSIESGKIAHAYLFSGPRGCGKTSSARILAKALNCQTGTVATPCGTCTSCREITAGANIDVIEIDGASNTSVNDVRQIKDEVLFPPNASRYKIYIIDEVHMLSTSAFNALLKTIEEPPPYVIFIFATTELHKVPATIKSRCQQFNFKLVDVEQLKQALAQTAEELHMKADDEALYWIAREATGSVRDCYTLFDQVAAFSDGHITFEKIQTTLGLTGIDSIGALLSACVQKDAKTALLSLDTILQNGVSTEQFAVDCTNYIRSLLLLQQGITKESLIGQRADRFPQQIVQGWNTAQLERALSLLLQLFRDMRFSLNPRYELELVVSRFAWLSDYVSPQELKAAFDAAQQLLTGGTASVSAAHTPQRAIPQKAEKGGAASPFAETGGLSPPRTAGAPHTAGTAFTSEAKDKEQLPQQHQAYGEAAGSLDSIDALKEELIRQLRTEHSMTAIALEKTLYWREESGCLHISVRTPFEVQLLQKERALLSQKASALYVRPLKVQINLAEDEMQKPKVPAVPDRVEMVRRNLKGSIVDVQKKAQSFEPEEE